MNVSNQAAVGAISTTRPALIWAPLFTAWEAEGWKNLSLCDAFRSTSSLKQQQEAEAASAGLRLQLSLLSLNQVSGPKSQIANPSNQATVEKLLRLHCPNLHGCNLGQWFTQPLCKRKKTTMDPLCYVMSGAEPQQQQQEPQAALCFKTGLIQTAPDRLQRQMMVESKPSGLFRRQIWILTWSGSEMWQKCMFCILTGLYCALKWTKLCRVIQWRRSWSLQDLFRCNYFHSSRRLNEPRRADGSEELSSLNVGCRLTRAWPCL